MHQHTVYLHKIWDANAQLLTLHGPHFALLRPIKRFKTRLIIDLGGKTGIFKSSCNYSSAHK
jgi:2-phosphoglycerate kinase